MGSKEQFVGNFGNSRKAFRSGQIRSGNELIAEHSWQCFAPAKRLNVFRKLFVATQKTKSELINFAAEVHRTGHSASVIGVGRSK